jgi:hypothetical protein
MKKTLGSRRAPISMPSSSELSNGAIAGNAMYA